MALEVVGAKTRVLETKALGEAREGAKEGLIILTMMAAAQKRAHVLKEEMEGRQTAR